MRKICIILTLLTVTMWIPGASAQNAENSPSDADIQRVENLLATMTVEQKVGQMFMVSLFGHINPARWRYSALIRILSRLRR